MYLASCLTTAQNFSVKPHGPKPSRSCRVKYPTYAEFALCCISLRFVPWSQKEQPLHWHSFWAEKNHELRWRKQSSGKFNSVKGKMMWPSGCRNEVISLRWNQLAISTEGKWTRQHCSVSFPALKEDMRLIF